VYIFAETKRCIIIEEHSRSIFLKRHHRHDGDVIT